MLPDIRKLVVALTGLLALTLAVACQTVKANAQLACYGGVYGGLVNADLETALPINIGANGQTAGITGGCDYPMGAIVAGVGASYGWMFGDLKTLGASNELDLFARLGLMVNDKTLVYGLAGWTQLYNSVKDIDGIKVGGGIESKLGESPLYLDLRYTYAMYDIDEVVGPASGLEANAHSVRVGLTVKIGAPAAGKK